MADHALTSVTLTIQCSDGYRRALAQIHEYEADGRGRATVEAMQDGFAEILALFLDDAMQEYARRRAPGRRRG